MAKRNKKPRKRTPIDDDEDNVLEGEVLDAVHVGRRLDDEVGVVVQRAGRLDEGAAPLRRGL